MMRTESKSGYKGVSPRGNKFEARIFFQGKAIRLGIFNTAEDAHAAYLEAAEQYHGMFACAG